MLIPSIDKFDQIQKLRQIYEIPSLSTGFQNRQVVKPESENSNFEFEEIKQSLNGFGRIIKYNE